jgi:hypothetical protein
MTKHPKTLVALANRLKISVDQLLAFAAAQGLSVEDYVQGVEAAADRMLVPQTFTDDDPLAFLD